MRWKSHSNRELHPIHWVWMWAPAAIFLAIIGLALGLEWLTNQKRKLVGPSLEWRPWFAWHPVDIDGGQAVWLEWIERQRTAHWDFTDYRALTSGERHD